MKLCDFTHLKLYLFTLFTETCPAPSELNCDATLGDSASITDAPLPISFVDPDGITNTEFSFSLVSVSPNSNYFSVDNTTGAVSIATVLDVDVTKVTLYYLTIRIEDMDGLSTEFMVYVTIVDINDNSPVPENTTYVGTVYENSDIATVVSGLNIRFNDIDSDLFSELVYTLDPSNNFILSMPNSTVILTNVEFDYETDPLQYELVISAMDMGVPPNTGVANIIIDILDENDNRPEISATADPLPTYIEGGPPITVADINITDADSEIFPMQYAIVRIIDAVDPQESLGHTGIIPASLTVNINGNEITIIGVATPAEYTNFLDTVTYQNLADEMTPPLERTISFGISDLSNDAFSYTNITINLQRVNDQPLLNCTATGFVTLPSINEDISLDSNPGEYIRNIISGLVSDIDLITEDSDIGIAVIAVTNTGIWQYAVSDTSPYISFGGSVSESSATVLGPNSKVRFLPTSDSVGSASITFKAWDLSDTLSIGATAIDTTSSDSDSSSPFSTSTCEATLEILPVNDAPSIDLDMGGSISPNFSTSYTENQIPKVIYITDPMNVVIQDIDDKFLQSLTVKITKDDGSCDLPDYPDVVIDDLIAANLSAFGVSEDIVYDGGACWTFTYTANLTLEQWEWFIGMIRFSINNTEPSDHTRRIEYVINDGEVNSAPVYSFVEVFLVSDNCPEITLIVSSPLIFTERGSAIIIDSNVTVVDLDFKAMNPELRVSIVLSSTEIENSFGANGVETAIYNCSTCILDAIPSDTVTVVYNSDDNVLTLEGPATPKQYQDVLKTLTFVDTGSEPSFASMITMTIELEDEESLQCPPPTEVTIVLESINDFSPEFRLNGADLNFTVSYTEDDTEGSSIVGDISISDPDTIDSTSYDITIEIVAGYETSEDELVIPDSSLIQESSNSKIILQGTLKQLAIALATIKYKNTNLLRPSTHNRIIGFYLSDNSLNSEAAFTRVTISAVNDPPSIDLNPLNPFTSDISVIFAVAGDPVLIATDGASITDPDSDNLVSMTLLLEEVDTDGNVQDRKDIFSESLIFSAVSGITGSYDQNSGVLSLSGVAALSDYQTLLETVKYQNSDNSPSLNNRRVTVTISDGSLTDSAASLITLGDIPNPPVVDLNGENAGQNNEVSFTTKEDEPVILAPQAVITDIDGDNICSAIISYTGPTDSCSPSFLSFDHSFSDISIDPSPITDGTSYTVNTSFTDECRETIIFDSILRGMTFEAPDDTSAGVCTVTVRVVDARDSISNQASITITVIVGNEPPSVDLDLGRVDRHFSFEYVQDVDIVRHIVSIYNESLVMNLTSLSPVGEAPGEAAPDGAADDDFGVAILRNLSYAGYSLTDTDSEELEYLSVRFIYNTPSELMYDLIRFPCISTNESVIIDPQVCISPGKVISYSDLTCDPDLFDACNNPVDLCTNLTVEIDCGKNEYLFQYSDQGTVLRYEELLGNLGYQYSRNESIFNSLERTINITASDGRAVSAGALVSILVVRRDDTPEIPDDASFQMYEDERPNRGFVYYTLPVTAPDGSVILEIEDSDIDGVFTMDEFGDFRLISKLDRETKPFYFVTISARFTSSDPRVRSTGTVVIEILDVNDNIPSVQAEYTADVYENLEDQFVVQVNATDSDAGLNGQVMYAPLLGIGAEKFHVNKSTGVITTAEPLKYNETVICDYYLLVLIIQDLGEIPYQTHTVINVNVLPTPPDTVECDTDNSIDEVTVLESASPFSLGSAVAFEAGTMDSSFIRYRIVSVIPPEDPAPFDVDSLNGSVNLILELDAERSQLYIITTEAYSLRSDIIVMSAFCNITVTVEDVDEFTPTFLPPGPYIFDVSEGAQVGDVITTLEGRDEDVSEETLNFIIVAVFDRLEINIPEDFPFTLLLNGTIILNKQLDFETQVNYTFEVSVSDTSGNPDNTDTTTVTIRVNNVNDNPPFFIGTPYIRAVRETAANGTTVLNLTVTDLDEDSSDHIELKLLNTTGPFCLEGNTIIVCNSTELTAYEVDRVFYVTVQAIDVSPSEIFTNETTAQFNLVLINEYPPQFPASDMLSNVIRIYEQLGNCSEINPHAAEIGDEIHDFQAFDDQDGGISGTIVDYTLIDAAELFFAIDSDTGQLEVSGCVDADVQNQYTLTIVATDGEDDDGTSFNTSQDISIRIDDLNDHPPVITSKLTFTIRENETVNADVQSYVFGQLTATDGDILPANSEVSFSRSDDTEGEGSEVGCPSKLFGLQQDSGRLFVCQELDFETVEKEYIIPCRAQNTNGEILNSAGSLVSERNAIFFDVIVYLVDNNEHRPNIIGDNFEFEVKENEDNQTFIGTIGATDADAADVESGMIQYFLSLNPTVGIDGSCTSELPFYATSNGSIHTCDVFNYEDITYYSFYVSVCDKGNPIMCVIEPESVSVTIIDRNDNPPIFSDETLSITLPENQTADPIVVLSWTDADSEANSIVELTLLTTGTPFGLDGANVVVNMTEEIDYEEDPIIYQLEILADNQPSDPDDVAQNDTIVIYITLSDINDVTPSIFDPTEFAIFENEPIGSFVGSINVTDIEEGDNGRLTFSSDSEFVSYDCSGDSVFRLDAVYGNISTCIELDYEERSDYTCTIVVCDNGLPTLCDQNIFFVFITDLNDNKPIFAQDPIELEINENSMAGLGLHSIVTTDIDSGANSEVSFTFLNTTVPFDIRNDNEIYYTGDSQLNYESSIRKFILQLRATNVPSVPTDVTQVVDVVVIIDVTDRNDNPPVFENDFDEASVDEHSPFGFVVYNVSTTDGDSLPNSDVYYEVLTSDSPFIMEGSMVTVNDTEGLDREEIGNHHILEIQAINEPDAADDVVQYANFTLNVTIVDINDNHPYIFGLTKFMVPEDFVNGMYFRRITARDADSGENARIQHSILSSTACPYDAIECTVTGEGRWADTDGLSGDFGSAFGSGGDMGCTYELPFDIDPDSGWLQLCHALDFERYFMYTFSVKVCDSGLPQLCNTSDVTVTVTDINDNEPIIRGPTEFTVNETVTFGYQVGCVNATDDDTGLGGIVSFYSEEVVECSTDFPFEVNDTTGCIDVCATLDFENRMSYTFELRVSDLGDPQLNSTTNVTIYIGNINDHGPTITSPAIASVIENAVNEFVINVTAIDIDHSPHNELTFSLLDDANGRFVITAEGQVYTKQALNREAMSYHLITVEVSDMVFSVDQIINVTVSDVNDETPVYEGASTFNVIENSDISITLDFVDGDIGINAELTLSTDDPRFDFYNDSLTLRNVQNIDRDPNTGGSPTVTLQIVAIDQGFPPQISDPVNITLIVEDVNDNPPIPLAPFRGNVTDGTPEDTFVIEFIATDYDEGINAELNFTLLDNQTKFYINSSSLFTNDLIELEGVKAINISITVLVSDQGSPSFSTSYTVIIFVVDSLPDFTPDTYKFYAVENIFSFDIGQVFAADRDLVKGNEDFVFSINSSSPYGGFTIINSTLFSPDSYLDYEDNTIFNLILEVGDGEMVFDKANVTVCLNDTNDVPPHLSPINSTFSLIENTAEGSILGQVVGIDLDTGENGRLAYRILSGENAALFDIDDDGNLKLVNSSAANFEVYQSFLFTYDVCDNGIPKKCSDPGYIIINVIDLDDVAPVFNPKSYSRSISELFGADMSVLVVSVTDEDTSVVDLTFELIPEQTKFVIQQVTGIIRTTSDLVDYESAQSHSFTVVVTDTAGLNDTATVTITVIDEDDIRAEIESSVSMFQPLEDSDIPISFAAISVIDEDSVSQDMIDQVTVDLRSNPQGNYSFPIDGGFCDHANSSYIESDSYSLCGLGSLCVNFHDYLLPLGAATESNGIIHFPGGLNFGIARPIPADAISISGEDLSGNFTFSVWAKLEATGQIIQFEVSPHIPFIVHVTAAGIINIFSTQTTDSPNQREIVTSTGPSLFDDAYHHIGISRIGLTMNIYIDGVLRGSSDKAGDVFTGFAGFVTIIVGEDLSGYLAQIRFCTNTEFDLMNFICLTTCGEVFGATSTENITASVDHRTRSVVLQCNSPNSCSLEEMNTAVDMLTFINVVDEPNPLDRGLFIKARDSNGFGDEAVFIIRPKLVNDKLPILDLNGLGVSGIDYESEYEERSDPIAIVGSEAVLYDLDSGYWQFSHIVVQLFNLSGLEALTVETGDIPEGVNITKVGSIVTISSSSNQYPEVFLDALKTIYYSSEEEDPSDDRRVVKITVYDFEAVYSNNPVALVNITVTPANDPPELNIDITSVEIDEELRMVTLLEDAVIEIVDPDDTQMSAATLTLLDQVNDDETLSLDTGDSGLTAVYDTNTGVLLISGVASTDIYIAQLKKVIYNNPSLHPTEADRQILVSVTDESGDMSMSLESVTITIDVFNDPPVVIFDDTGNGTYSTTFTEDKDTCIKFFGNISVSDPENIGISRVEIGIIDPNSDEYLTTIGPSPVNGLFFPNTGNSLALFSLDPPNIDVITESLKTVYYCNDAEEPVPGLKIIDLTFSDVKLSKGQQKSTTIQSTITIIAVNDIPFLTIEAAEGLAFGGETTPFINPDSIEFGDNDDSKFNEIKIIITNAQDGVINEFIQAAGNLPGGGLLSDDGAFTFTITYPMLADDDTIISSIKELRYNNLAPIVSADVPRTICVQVNDTKVLSNPSCVNITLSQPNQFSPQFLNDSSSLVFSYDETSSSIIIGSVYANDSDTDPVASLVFYSIDSIISIDAEGAIKDTTSILSLTIDSETGLIEAPMGFDAEEYIFHNVTLRARDNGNPNRHDFVSLVVTISDLNDNSPFFIGLPYTVTGEIVREELVPPIVIFTLQADDNDQSSANNEIISYGLVNNFIADGYPIFIIDSTNGIISSNQTIDAEEYRYFILNVSVTDGGSPPLTTYTTLEVIPLDLNDNPPKVDQLISALYPTSERIPRSIGPAIRVTDEDESIAVSDISVQLTNPESFTDYLSCLLICQDERLEEEGLLGGVNGAIDLLSLATFTGLYVTDITIGQGNCDAKNFVRNTITPSDNGYGRIPQSSIPNLKFTNISFSFVLNITNEGFVVGMVNTADENAAISEVDRIFAIRIRKRIFSIHYSYADNVDQANHRFLSTIPDSPFSEFFETIPGVEFNTTRHYVVVIHNDKVYVYVNCDFLYEVTLLGVPIIPDNITTDLTIGRIVPSDLSQDGTNGQGHLGGDLHGLYYYPYPLKIDEIQSICTCETIKPPASYPPTISIAEQTTTSISIEPAGDATSIPAEDAASFLQGIKYQYRFEDIPETSKTIEFVATDSVSLTSTETGTISFVEEDTSLPFIDLNGPLVSGNDYIAAYTEDAVPVAITPNAVSIARDNELNLFPTIENITIELLNPLDGDESEILSAESTEFISVMAIKNTLLQIHGPGLSGEFSEVLQSLTYENTHQDPITSSPRNISFTLYDTEGRFNNPLSFTTVTVVPVNDPAVLSFIDNGLDELQTVVYTEAKEPVAIANGLYINDVDNDYIQSAVANISQKFIPGKDQLTVETIDDVVATYDSSTGVLTLSGNASLESYQNMSRSIKFSSSDNPLLDETEELMVSLKRTVTIIVNDGTSDSNSVEIEVQFLPFNDPTSLRINGNGVIEFEEGEDPVLIAPYAYLLDSDNEMLGSLMVIFEEGGEIGDVFVYGGIQSAVLSFEADTLDNFVSILRNIRYYSTDDEPSLANRTIIITIVDLEDNKVEERIIIIVSDRNEHPPTFDNLPYTFSVDENAESNTLVGTISATDNDQSITEIAFSANSSSFTLTTIDSSRASIYTTKTFDFESDPILITFNVTASDGVLTSMTTVTVTIEDINESPSISLDVLSFVAAAQQSRQLIQGSLDLADPDTSDTITVAILELSGVPADSIESLTLNQSISGYTFTNKTIESMLIYTLTRSGSAVVNMENALKYIQYTAGDIVDPLSLRTVMLVVEDSSGVESNEVSIEVTLADIPQFEEDDYSAKLLEEESHSDFLQIQATVANPNDTIQYNLKESDGFTIDETTGYLSLTGELDYEETQTVLLEVYAIANVPLPRTATTTVLITVVDKNDVAPEVSGVGNITIEVGVPNHLFEDIGVTDPDTFPIVETQVTITSDPLMPSVFSGKVCVDETNAINKMVTVCGLSTGNFINLLTYNDTGLGASISFDEYSNRILTTSDSYARVAANLSDFEGTIDQLTFAFWVKPDTDGSGYIAFFSNDNASVRYFTVYYDSPDRIIVSLKQVDVPGLVGQVQVVFQLPNCIEDDVYHFIMIYYSERNIMCSVDGVKVESMAVFYANIFDQLFGE